ncbi:hypothetical protein EM858_14635 [Agrobacterium sp. CNPSo 2736]|uniref:hypothetical protein n=1 Tax=Agrobacterium TaxID=357 RepID=UPI000FD99C23|nr:hypothetical protein [Agrobacterium sp. CNPSo 2736]NSZ73945.1 hypothetical protein [Agrobacterium tumefaciens]RVT75680.1 hypothetical protein EM858_14635 [Agrobacterium sp. CNPSo 2736]
MLDHGHPSAWFYPVCKVFVEARFVVDRINAQMASEAALLQMAISTIPNQSVKKASTKKAQEDFRKQLKVLNNGEP